MTDAVLGQLMLAFEGRSLPERVRARLTDAPSAGATLFRAANAGSASELRALTDALQRCAASRGDPPLLVAADQEGGQLMALGVDTTPFPGAMALGATGDAALAERVAAATGRELRALGINVNYAPVCDLATNRANPALGIRTFGDEPSRVAPLVAATIRGLQSAGVAATAKHFPGMGDVMSDTHHGEAAVWHARERLAAVELAPFRAAIAAGAQIVMSSHAAVPRLSGVGDLPATLDPAVMIDLLRDQLGFGGVTISDALDMHALAQGPSQVLDALAALRAGVDLLLCAPGDAAIGRIEDGLRHAARRRLADPGQALDRIATLRRWIGGFEQPDLAVVGCAEHQALAREVAERSVTLVRDRDRLLPLRPADGSRILAIMPQPIDLTPADTSSTVAPGLAAALRRRHSAVDEIVTAHPPTDADIAAVRERAADAAVVIVGTISASLDPAQARMVDALLETGVPTVTVALRTPWEGAAYPAAGTHVCTYGILPPSLEALTAALFGDSDFPGRLPVAA
jgi:beta-N-acetylhexosaminidase